MWPACDLHVICITTMTYMSQGKLVMTHVICCGIEMWLPCDLHVTSMWPACDLWVHDFVQGSVLTMSTAVIRLAWVSFTSVVVSPNCFDVLSFIYTLLLISYEGNCFHSSDFSSFSFTGRLRLPTFTHITLIYYYSTASNQLSLKVVVVVCVCVRACVCIHA